MIVDAFIFCKEIELLKARLEYLYDTIDNFVIVESDKFFNGNTREPVFPKVFDTLEDKYKAKIKYKIVSPDTSNMNFNVDISGYNANIDHWKVEAIVRNGINDVITEFPNPTFVLISDIDEIPNKTVIKPITNHISRRVPKIVFQQLMFYYNFDKVQKDHWFGTIITTARHLREIGGAQALREQRNNIERINAGGWHLSCWMTPEEIAEKIKTFSHQEYNKEQYTNIDNIIKNIRDTGDYLGRSYNEFYPFGEDKLPESFRNIFSRTIRA